MHDIRTMYLNGDSTRDIARALNTNNVNIMRKLKAMGVPLRAKGESVSLAKNKAKPLTLEQRIARIEAHLNLSPDRVPS